MKRLTFSFAAIGVAVLAGASCRTADVASKPPIIQPGAPGESSRVVAPAAAADLSHVGYTEADIPDLVPGTMKQQRILATCPRPVTEEDIAGIFARSIENW